MLQNTQKITASLPKALLQNAQAMTGLGITETLKRGLEQLTRTLAYKNVQKLRGKGVEYFRDFDLNELRKDREEE